VKGLRTHALAWTGLWLALVLIVLGTRPLLPIDETRYASVAWEMWLRRSLLVPYVNGAPYADKPPLLFWLVLAGWKVLGVREWWMRLVPPAFSLGSVFLVYRLARELWPGREGVARLAAWSLLGTVAWALYGTLFYFDMLVAFFSLVGVLGVVGVWRRGGWGGWLLAGAGLGLGVLAKGPVVFLYVAPVALLAPWWAGPRDRSWARWYAGALAALLLGAAIGLAWALPAARAGGEEYASRILWHQTADRIVRPFSHVRPFWWYLPWLPLLAFPWLVSPAVWRGLRRVFAGPRDPAVRLLLAWLVPALLLFSVIPSKQLHYLMPIVPPLALLVGRGLGEPGPIWRGRDLVWPAFAFGLVALVLLLVPRAESFSRDLASGLPPWAFRVGPAGGLLLLLASTLLPRVRAERWRVPALATVGLLALAVLHVSVMRQAAPYYDVRPAAQRIRVWQEEGRAIANAATYHSQFQYLGRLEHPVEQIRLQEAPAWMREHPGGKVVAYHKRFPLDVPIAPDFTQPFKGRTLAVWGERAVLEAPEWPPKPAGGR
jgi:4-amino-4-deoxy-L-arabinose transferase-like glycosyltransferase